MQFDELVQTSAAVAATSSRLEKVAKLAALLRRAPLDEVATVIGFLIGFPRQERSASAGRPSPVHVTASPPRRRC